MKSPRKGLLYISIVLVVLILGLTGCRDDDEETTAEKEEALCFALIDLRIQVVELRQGPAPSTVGEIRYRLEQINEAWEEVQERAEDVDAAQIEDVEAAQEDLEEAIGDLPDDMPTDEARAAIQPEVDALLNAEQALAEDTNCIGGFVPTASSNVPTTVPGEPTATETLAATEAPTAAPTETPVPATETPAPTATPELTPTETAPTATEVAPTSTEVVATPTAEASTPTPVAGQMIYEADWTAGAGEWVLGAGWTAENGTLLSDGSAAASLIAPFALETRNYAVEVELQVQIDGAPACPEIVGLMARVVAQVENPALFEAGYVAGVCTTEWDISAVLAPEEAATETVLERLASGPRELDAEPHLYRLEVNGTQLRLFIDGEFVGEVANDMYSEAGSAGIYLGGNYTVTVTSFQIFALE